MQNIACMPNYFVPVNKVESSTTPETQALIIPRQKENINESENLYHNYLKNFSRPAVLQSSTTPNTTQMFVNTISQEIVSNIQQDSINYAASWFDAAFLSRGNFRKALVENLLKWTSPELIIRSAILKFNEKGNEDRLRFAISLLYSFPDEAVASALETLGSSPVGNKDIFLAISEFFGSTKPEPRNALSCGKSNPNYTTTHR